MGAYSSSDSVLSREVAAIDVRHLRINHGTTGPGRERRHR